jgi:hypothetical protein
MEESTRLVYATFAHPGTRSETDALVLSCSVREFGGSTADSPIWCFYPESDKVFSSAFLAVAKRIGIQLTPFKIAREDLKKWFVPHAEAAARAESEAEESADVLVWLNANTVVVQEPTAFLLPTGVSLGYRPAHHVLIGSRYDKDLDPFWSLVYRICEVPEDRVYAMQTHVEDVRVRPYFNAGFLAVRPEAGVLRSWRDLFVPSYSLPEMESFYNVDNRYQIFAHQAILSGLVLSELRREQTVEMPPTYNYPVHLHNQDLTRDRPQSITETVVFRHEGFYTKDDWSEQFPADQQFTRWLVERVEESLDPRK